MNHLLDDGLLWLWIIFGLAWLSVVLTIICAAGALVWLAITVFRLVRRWYISQRNERHLRDHMLSRQGFRAAARRGWVREDLQ